MSTCPFLSYSLPSARGTAPVSGLNCTIVVRLATPGPSSDRRPVQPLIRGPVKRKHEPSDFPGPSPSSLPGPPLNEEGRRPTFVETGCHHHGTQNPILLNYKQKVYIIYIIINFIIKSTIKRGKKFNVFTKIVLGSTYRYTPICISGPLGGWTQVLD